MTLRQMVATPGPAVSTIASGFLATFYLRVKEAAVTTGLETFLVLLGVRNGHFNITHPNGYTKGWAVVGQQVEQWQFGVFLLVFACVRGPVVIFGSYQARLCMALFGLYVSLAVDMMVRRANPDAPVLPYQDMLALTNLWIVVALIGKIYGVTWADVFRALRRLLHRGRRAASA